MADRFGIYCASFVHAGGTLNLQQLNEQGLGAGSRFKTIRPGGALDPAAHILSTANPRARFVTNDIFTVLTAMAGNWFLTCSGGHVMRYQKRLPGGAFATGTDHFIQSTGKGFLHVTSLSVDIDSDEGATLALEYIPLSTAGENPITETESQSLGAVAAPAFVSQYFMGGFWLDAVQALGLKRVTVAPGIGFGTNRSDGGVFPRYDSSSIIMRDPMMEMSFLNAAISKAVIGSFFLSALGASAKAYFQRGTTAADGRIAAASASHLRVVAAGGSWGAQDLSVGNVDDATTSVAMMITGSLTPTLGVALGA